MRELRERGGELSPDRLRQLVLDATGSELEADDVAARRAIAISRRETR